MISSYKHLLLDLTILAGYHTLTRDISVVCNVILSKVIFGNG